MLECPETLVRKPVKEAAMSALPPTPNPDGEPDDDRGTTPRWVYIFATVAIVVILLFVILLISGGSHTPGRHTP